MNKRVTLAKSPDETPDSDGFWEALTPEDWWCSIEPLEPSATDGERTIAYRVVGRYHAQITVDTRIRYGSRDLFVKGVQNVGEANRELQLYCEEVVP
jgi:head-tail adaptor